MNLRLALLCALLCLSFTSLAHDLSSVPAGHPNKGTLRHARDLHAHIKKFPHALKSASPREFQFGTHFMAIALEKIGSWAIELGHAPVHIGDISLKNGGKLARHLTHQRGLDADIAYLSPEPKTPGHRADRFHNRFLKKWQTPEEVAFDFPLEANYALIKNVIQHLDVAQVFVGCSIFDALEKHDKKQPISILDQITAQKGHEDHFHIRIRCPEELAECSNKWWIDPSQPKKKDRGTVVNGKWRDC